MQRHYKTNPYCSFKDDRERRLALNVRAVTNAIAVVALAASQTDLMEKFRLLTTWLQ